jgi:hypothetical protein
VLRLGAGCALLGWARQRNLMYEVAIRESMEVENLRVFLHGPTLPILARVWRRLWLPRKVRALWESGSRLCRGWPEPGWPGSASGCGDGVGCWPTRRMPTNSHLRRPRTGARGTDEDQIVRRGAGGATATCRKSALLTSTQVEVG